MKRSSHHIIIPILAIVLLAVSSCFKTDTGIPSIRDFEELIRRVPVSGVRLNVTARTLNVGDTYTLTPTVTPSNATEKGVSWTSSNTGVATVDQSGKVTALKEGSAIITAKTTDGGYTATCSVMVKPAEIIDGAVDLGLSVKWASCNLGASRPEEYGGYYQWAGTQDVTSTSINLSWSNCPYHTGTSEFTGWTKYVPSDKSSYWSGSGNPDSKTVLDLDDDVAHAKLGDKWRMPTDEEWSELTDNCTWTWTTENGVNGYKVTGRKAGYTDKSIFLPAAGNRSNDILNNTGTYGYYWSSSLCMSYPGMANYMYFGSIGTGVNSNGRYCGQSLRPVYGEQKIPVSGVKLNKTSLTLAVSDTYTLTPTISPSDATERGVSWTSSNTSVATVDQNGKVTAVNAGSATITVRTTDGGYTATCSVTVKQPELVPPEAVDLGLSVKWASWNLGASKPEEYGGYYQWAGTQDVTDENIFLDLNNCPYHTGSSEKTGWTKYVPSDKSSYWSGSGSPDNKTVLDPGDDVAHVSLGGNWRIPTDAEWVELKENCTWTWMAQNGVYGYELTSKKLGYTDRSIFLPAAGNRQYGSLNNVGTHGYYKSSSLDTYTPELAYFMYFYSDGVSGAYGSRCNGRTVRPVQNNQEWRP